MMELRNSHTTAKCPFCKVKYSKKGLSAHMRKCPLAPSEDDEADQSFEMPPFM